MEHQDFDGMFSELRGLTKGFAPPEGACRSYATLFSMLRKIDGDLTQHAEYEEAELFPSAVEQESACIG